MNCNNKKTFYEDRSCPSSRLNRCNSDPVEDWKTRKDWRTIFGENRYLKTIKLCNFVIKVPTTIDGQLFKEADRRRGLEDKDWRIRTRG